VNSEGEFDMTRKLAFVLTTTIVFGAMTGIWSTSARAVSIEELIAACDKMDKAKPGSCSYKTYEKTVRGMSGCAGNVYFDCPADGKRLCFAVPGKGGKVGETQLPSP
jgi:hypothetical protein